MICDHCGADIEDLEANRLMGVKFAGDGYESVGERYLQYPSWFCLKFFKTYNQRIEHDRKFHKRGDPQMGMVPSGISADFDIKCGMENVILAE
jgi:outer membrane lipoprotein-sorting protein